MANFGISFDKTMGHEGFYSNDPTDAGGETYRGISRKFHPAWDGWEIIDIQKPDIIHADLDPHVRQFYRDHYWNPNKLTNFTQEISNEIFDSGVNMGIGRVAKYFQEALNYLNRNQVVFADLLVDGDIGNKTISAYKKLPDTDRPVLLKILNILQGNHYLEYMKKDPTQEKYARGWLARVSL